MTSCEFCVLNARVSLIFVCKMDPWGHLLEQLLVLRNTSTVIVGIGSTLRGDDGIGPLACSGLSGKVSARVIDAAATPENYIQKIIDLKPQNLLIIDALDFGASPGTTRIFQTQQLSSFALSTHTLSPRLFVEMVTKSLDVNVLFLGIQPASTAFGQGLSHQVAGALGGICRVLMQVFPAVGPGAK